MPIFLTLVFTNELIDLRGSVVGTILVGGAEALNDVTG